MIRSAGFAAVCVVVSVGLHLWAGGDLIGPGALAAALVLVAAGAFALAGRQRGLGGLLVASFAAQYGLHHLFGTGEVLYADALTSGTHHPSGDGSGLGMVLVHALTAVLSAWWLERGESALATLVCHAAASAFGLHTRLTRLLLLPVVPCNAGPAVVPARRDDPAPAARDGFAACLSRRGPPAPVSVL